MRTAILSTAFVAALTMAAAADTTTVTFENGNEGWFGPSGPGGTTVIEPDGGNPGANLHTVFQDFGIVFRNGTNEAFIGDYTAKGDCMFSFDMNIYSISDFIGNQVPRPFIVELRDYDNPPGGYPWVSVWTELDWFSGNSFEGWMNFEVEITDVMSEDLPEGWGGFGAEDPDTYEPELPAGRTWTNVLEGVDEIVISTLEPGWFFISATFDVALDNISITTGGGSDCDADLNGDEMVDGADLGLLLGNWGNDGDGDLNGDEMVDGADLGLLLGAWGDC